MASLVTVRSPDRGFGRGLPQPPGMHRSDQPALHSGAERSHDPLCPRRRDVIRFAPPDEYPDRSRRVCPSTPAVRCRRARCGCPGRSRGQWSATVTRQDRFARGCERDARPRVEILPGWCPVAGRVELRVADGDPSFRVSHSNIAARAAFSPEASDCAVRAVSGHARTQTHRGPVYTPSPEGNVADPWPWWTT
jgi:hypothetical protein